MVQMSAIEIFHQLSVPVPGILSVIDGVHQANVVFSGQKWGSRS